MKTVKSVKNRAKKLDIIQKFAGETLVPVTYLHARFRRSVVDLARAEGLIIPAYTAQKAVLFHRDAVENFDRRLASGELVISRKRG